MIDIEKVSGSAAAGSPSKAGDDAEDSVSEDLPAKTGTVSDTFTVDKTDRYVEIDDDETYLLDEDVKEVPDKGSKILYRAVDDRIIDLEEVDPGESGE